MFSEHMRFWFSKLGRRKSRPHTVEAIICIRKGTTPSDHRGQEMVNMWERVDMPLFMGNHAASEREEFRPHCAVWLKVCVTEKVYNHTRGRGSS